MLFDTPIFFVFLALVCGIYWMLPHGRQNKFLLAASYFFYGWWDYRFLLLMAGSTILDFVIARAIDRCEEPNRRRRLLVASLVVNFAILGVFKYFNFFVESFISSASALGFENVPVSLIHVLLPPGISFYTFQEVAYIVDVYNRRLKASDSLVEYALFISLFPHLIAGPIQRPGHLLPQVQRERQFDDNKFFDGILLIVQGLFRKCVVADNCALLANAAFAGHLGHSVWAVLIGAYAFAWQIYGDFSGYSDMARGAAQMLGFHFMVNFRQPYLSATLQDFWRRWHVSLSTWLRDYLYIPLGGSAHGERKTYRNLVLTMVLGGLWHGANWTFVIWGTIHGGYLAIERYVRRALGWAGEKGVEAREGSALSLWLKRVLVFQFVCLAWVFFRAESLRAAITFLGGMRNLTWQPEYLVAFQFLALFSIPLFALDLLLERDGEEYVFQHRSPALRTATAVAVAAMIALLSANQANAFIYFQF
jgi:alginate O-acetyltransferase complex protein AlgI